MCTSHQTRGLMSSQKLSRFCDQHSQDIKLRRNYQISGYVFVILPHAVLPPTCYITWWIDITQHAINTGYCRTMVTPVMTRPGLAWSTMWGSVSPTHYYEWTDDYNDIITRTKQ